MGQKPMDAVDWAACDPDLPTTEPVRVIAREVMHIFERYSVRIVEAQMALELCEAALEHLRINPERLAASQRAKTQDDWSLIESKMDAFIQKQASK